MYSRFLYQRTSGNKPTENFILATLTLFQLPEENKWQQDKQRNLV